MKIKKGDTVKMLYGKDSGRQGQVVAVDTKKGKIVVEGLNMYKKHLKGDGRNQVSEIITITKAVSISKVMLVCPNCNKPTRVEFQINDDEKDRVCKKCRKVIAEVVVKEKEDKKETKKDEKKESKSKKSEK